MPYLYPSNHGVSPYYASLNRWVGRGLGGGQRMAELTQQTGAEWLVKLQNSCPTPAGVRTIGSICFTAVSAQSAFVPLNISNLSATNQSGSTPVVRSFSNRTIIIANEALLEAFRSANGQQTISLYGKPNTTYELQRTADLNPPVAWTPEWTNSVPAGMFRSLILDGPQTTAPILYLRAKEQ